MKLLAISPQPILIRGLESVISSTNRAWHMITFSGTSAEVADVVAREHPDVLLIDFDPAEHFGLVLDLRERVHDCRIVLLARDISPELAYQSLKAGVRGILRASAADKQLLECLATVHAGDYWCDDDLKSTFFSAKTAILSPRESQLIVLVSQGLKNKEIGTALKISPSTVRIYLSGLFQRLGVKDRYELAIYGLRTFIQDPRVPSIMDPALIPSDGSTPIRFLMLEKPRPKALARTSVAFKYSVAKAGI